MNSCNKIMLVAVLLMLLLAACKDKDAQLPATYPNYSMLKQGNYWIYERYSVDSNGTGSGTGVYDSCYVEKDTVINGFTYAKVLRPSLYSNTLAPQFLKDSLHYIVSATGGIAFSSQDFTTRFLHYYTLTGASPNSDTVSEVSVKMENKNVSYTVPAGSFITSDYLTHYYSYPGYDFAGVNRYLHVRYAQNIGIVSETMLFYSSNPNYTELRLVRYHVQ